MFAVIFKAIAAEQGADYGEMVNKMRDLAFEKYGCLDFVAVTEGDLEIAISYWESMDAIHKWKNDSEHSIAQQLGRANWYKSYSVQVVEIKKEYSF